MSYLFTKNGRPLQVSGQRVFAPSGNEIGRITGSKVYGPDGMYVGTIEGDRLVHRSTDSAAVSSAFGPTVRSPFTVANHSPSGIWGDEPQMG